MAPTVQLDVISEALQLSQAERRAAVTKVAFTAGLQAFGVAALASGGAVLGLLRFSPLFRRSLGISGKTALVVMPSAFAYTLVSEQTASRMAHPGAFDAAVRGRRITTLSVPQRCANFLYESPMRSLGLLGVPVVATIFVAKGRSPHLSFWTRLFHTRVLGQASVLSLLLSLALFHDWMDKRGLYLEEWEKEDQQRGEASE